MGRKDLARARRDWRAFTGNEWTYNAAVFDDPPNEGPVCRWYIKCLHRIMEGRKVLGLPQITREKARADWQAFPSEKWAYEAEVFDLVWGEVVVTSIPPPPTPRSTEG
jgi:hypothetical protein